MRATTTLDARTQPSLLADLRAASLTRLMLLGGFVAVVWLVELVNLVVFHGSLVRYGLHPHDSAWLWGILLAPLLHASLAHLAANTGPLLVLGGLVLLQRVRTFLLVTLLIVVLGGAGVWLLGSSRSVHVGASGLIFGYIGYLGTRGVLERRVGPLLLTLITLVLYGGVLWGVLPGQVGISWEGHLCGALAGIATAWLLARPRPARSLPPSVPARR